MYKLGFSCVKSKQQGWSLYRETSISRERVRMPAVAATAAATSASIAAADVSPHLLKHSQLFVPAGIAALTAYRHKGLIVDGSKKLLGPQKLLATSAAVAFEYNLSNLPDLSISSNSQCSHQKPPNGKALSHLFVAQTFGDVGGLFGGVPSLGRCKRSMRAPRAYKNETFGFRYPVLVEKPEWWWRTLACVPYLIALQISDTGYFIQPFLEHYDFLGELIFFVPGAITRLPAWFIMLYCYIAYICIVKNKDWPHFFRYHLMMGMLLETGLQVIWYASNFFPLIHYNGILGMHYWAGVGIAYIVILLKCVRCALAGGYANIPFISDAAYIHTLFNIGGFQRPF